MSKRKQKYASSQTGVDLLGMPIPRHEVVEAVHFMIRDAGENPTEPGFRIDTVHVAGLNKRVTAHEVGPDHAGIGRRSHRL